MDKHQFMVNLHLLLDEYAQYADDIDIVITDTEAALDEWLEYEDEDENEVSGVQD